MAIERMTGDRPLQELLKELLKDKKYIHPDDLDILYPSAWIAVGLGGALAIFGGVRPSTCPVLPKL
ncbi:MAG: hypothetical protein R3B49_02175 [Phycisphaerales bacterium]